MTMIIAPTPKNEAKRLQALKEYDILDTPTEEIFDVITKLAASICGTPICAISLIDQNRQWFKSITGLDVKETERDVAFCSHTIHEHDLLEVSDACQDERFRDNPLVTGQPKIKFYTGVPLKTPQGFNIGSLCVIDTKNNKLSDEQKSNLTYLSKIVMTLFESRKDTAKKDIDKNIYLDQLEEINKKIAEKLDQEKHINIIMDRYSEMSSTLQSCLTHEEAAQVINKYVSMTFPYLAGSLYLTNKDNDCFNIAAQWNSPTSYQDMLLANDCWSLRSTQPYFSSANSSDLICNHFSHNDEPAPSYMCLPLTAQSEAIGMICLEHTNKTEDINPSLLKFLKPISIRMAQNVSLALANIQLRKELYNQSMHDPLTTLHNRRYLSDFIQREIPRATRNGNILGVMMIDMDHFKNLNDQFGHHTGDAVLKEIATLLLDQIQTNEVVCRYGGEEFAAIIQGKDKNEIIKRANEIHKALNFKPKSLLELNGKQAVTASIGLAIFPTHHKDIHNLLKAADCSLYKAKESGRNKVAIYDPNEGPCIC